MKKLIFGGVVIAILFITSCSKSNTGAPSSPSGSWTFKSHTFNNTIVTNDGHGHVSAFDSTINNIIQNEIAFTFLGGNGAPGTYMAVTNVSNSGNNIVVQLRAIVGGYGPRNYRSTGGNGVNQPLNVTYDSAKVTISGTNIEVVNTADPTDSGTVSFTLKQR